jgi:hypothetical protein
MLYITHLDMGAPSLMIVLSVSACKRIEAHFKVKDMCVACVTMPMSEFPGIRRTLSAQRLCLLICSCVCVRARTCACSSVCVPP